MPVTEDELEKRNASAYKIASALFVGSLFAPLPFYYFLGVGENAPWPAITGLILSVVLPVGYHALRRRAGGPDFDEFLRYTELKDGFSRKATLTIFWTWIVFVIVAIFLVLKMAP